MSLNEKNIIDKIEILDNGCIQVRQANIIEKDSIEISRVFTRWTLTPGQDLINQPEKIIKIANLIWTPEVINNYKNLLIDSNK